MPFPAGMVMCNLDFAGVLTASGQAADVEVTIQLVAPGTNRLVWLADGTDIFKIEDTYRNPTVVPVPVTDQTGVTDGGQHPYTGWAYRVGIMVRSAFQSEGYAVTVQPVTGQTSIQVSRESDQTIAAPVVGPPVTVGGPVPQTFSFTNLTEWAITHNLGRIPIVQAIDANGDPIDGWLNRNDTSVIMTHSLPMSGSITLI